MMLAKKMSFNKEPIGICKGLTEQPAWIQRKQYFRVSDFSTCKPEALENSLLIAS